MLRIHPSALQPADIVVSTTPATVSWVIREVTGAPFSHAMLYVGNGDVIEAIPSSVVPRTLNAALSEATLAVAFRVRIYYTKPGCDRRGPCRHTGRGWL